MKKIKLGATLWDECSNLFYFWVPQGTCLHGFFVKSNLQWTAEYSLLQYDKYIIQFDSHDDCAYFIKKYIAYIDGNTYLCIPTETKSDKDNKDEKEFDPSTLVKHVDINEKKRIVTIVWRDGQITQGKCCEGDTFDPEKGIAIAWMKRPFSSTASMKRWMNKEILKSNIKYSAKKGYCKRYSGENAVEEMFEDLNKEDENAR